MKPESVSTASRSASDTTHPTLPMSQTIQIITCAPEKCGAPKPGQLAPEIHAAGYRWGYRVIDIAERRATDYYHLMRNGDIISTISRTLQLTELPDHATR